MADRFRPNPDELLKNIQKQQNQKVGGKLRVFLGMSPGVGKTYAMLQAARQRFSEGVDVIIGVVETHGRAETKALIDGIPELTRRKIDYKGTQLDEMDLDEVLKRKPQLVLVDELAHTNAPGSRHPKRYQDVLEILDQGIDVYTTLNVQHLDSRKESVERIAQVKIQETVPDSVLDRASQVELIDISPFELLKRLKEGKVYLGERAVLAAENFFKEGTLTALREIALRFTAERVDQQLRELVDKGENWSATERLMVAISHSPYSQSLIRATRRLAYNLEAPWVAVHIDTGVSLNNEDQAQLSKNLALARELGAEVVSTVDTSIPSALKRVARQKGVTQIIIGRPIRRWVRDYLEGGSLLDRLVRESGEVDVHVIRHETGARKDSTFWRRFIPTTGFSQYYYVFWALLVLFGVGKVLDPFLGYRAVGFVFLAGVLSISLFASVGPTVFAALASGIIWNYFFIPPIYTFVISAPEDLMMCLAYLLVALITGLSATRMRRQDKILREREERTNFLYEITREIVAGGQRKSFLDNILQRLGQLLDAHCNVFLKNDEGKLSQKGESMYHFAMDEKDWAVASWSFENRKRAGWTTETLPVAKILCIPLRGAHENLGVFAFRPNKSRRLSSEQENILYSVVRQIAVAIEQEVFEERARGAERLKESEALHQTLLNSISHELRTPLTAIIGSATALADEKTASDPKRRATLVQNLTQSGDRLNWVVANLLDMTRLSGGVLSLNRDWHDPKELVNNAISKLKDHTSQHTVEINAKEGLPLVNIDYGFMEHVICNLVINALTYSPPGTKVKVGVAVDRERILLTVEDQGAGIPSEQLTKIFEKFYRIPGTPAGGLGLGLSICKSIVELHGGTITVENRSEGGARFVVSIPYKAAPQLPGEG
jgi:two-component system sensor histidine kinase KdpD